MKRRVILTGAASAALVVALFVTWSVRPDRPAPAAPDVGAVEAEAQARKACTAAAVAVMEISSDASGERVFASLDRARESGQAAVAGDARWTQLASGVQALERSLRQDDARSADLSLRVVRTACEDLGVAVGAGGG